MHSHQMQVPEDVRTFVLAGNARLTLVSKRTGTRFTFKIRQPKPDQPHYVSLLTEPDNERGYTFFGTIFEQRHFRHSPRSSLGNVAPGPAAWRWFWTTLTQTSTLHPQLEVWHEGRCGRCGRTLTVPESIENGLGPECIKHQQRGVSHGRGTEATD
jgi:hypothetical protein